MEIKGVVEMTEMKELAKQVKELEDKLANADYQLEGRDNEIKELNERLCKAKEVLENLIYAIPASIAENIEEVGLARKFLEEI